MQITTLGPLTVSRLCLGTMLMGGATPPADAHRMLDRFVDAGGTFIDTADVYGDGESERTLAPDRVRAACEASLRRLRLDVIDLYQVHAPDPTVPLEESLAALNGLVEAGEVRALGASNFPAWLLAWSVSTQDREGWAPFVSLQPQYS